jgi:membrane-associated phospholipid phosphatase
MSISIDNNSSNIGSRLLGQLSRAAVSVREFARPLFGRMGANWSYGRRLWRGRTRDRRFALIPFSGYQIANTLAIFATAVLFLMLVFDSAVIEWRRSLPEPALDVFRFFNKVGAGDWLLVSTFALIVFGLARDVTEEPRRSRHRHFTRTAAASYLFVAVAIAGIIASLTKNILGRGRPSQFAEHGPFAFDHFAFVAKWASFPSGHATTIMALAVALALLMPRLRWVFLTLGFWIGFARIATGAHYPSDVLAGLALGGAFAWFLARVLAQRRIVFRFDENGSVVPLPFVVPSFNPSPKGQRKAAR